MKRSIEQRTLDAAIREDLATFIAKTFQLVSPADLYLHNWHIDVIADRLMQCYRGKITRLIITVPPRSLKSICASIAFPAWVLGKDPSRRIICGSYGYELSGKLAKDCKAVMQSDWYKQAFPKTHLKRNTDLDLETTKKGGRYGTSVGGAITGRGGNIIIIDDPLKPSDGLSETKRNEVNHWYDGTLFSRLDNKAEGVIILVMQRLHVDDLAAHVKKKGNWVHLDLPAISEIDQEFMLSDEQYFERHPGDILHPERESQQDLDDIKQTIGNYNFTAQYQQRPVPIEGNLIKWQWFQYYDEPLALDQGDQIVQSWDTALKATETSDYSVCMTIQIKGDNYYLLDVLRERLDYPFLRKAVIAQVKCFNAKTILIEDTASGTSLIQDIRHDKTACVPNPIAVTPKGDKVERMGPPSMKIEAGHVYLPRKAPWLDEFRCEFLAFPFGHFDDQVDALSQFLNWIDERRRKTIHIVRLSGL